MNPFNNPQIDIENLPEYETIEFIALKPSYRTALLISTFIFWVVIFLALGSSLFISILEGSLPFPIWAPIIIFGILFIFSLVHAIMGYRYKKYAIRYHDIQLKSGWIWQSTAIIPFNRIQHSEVVQGPIDRLYNLAKLKVFTAGGSSSDLKIPGLDHDEAHRLKKLITSRISSSEEE